MLAADYPFLDILWTMFIFFLFIIWIWILITVFADIFRRKDTSGFGKAAWIIFVILLPYLGVLVYLIANHDGMADRNIQKMQAQQEQMDAYVKSVAGSGGAAAEIEKAKGLLDSGAISQAEFDSIKAKALAGSSARFVGAAAAAAFSFSGVTAPMTPITGRAFELISFHGGTVRVLRAPARSGARRRARRSSPSANSCGRPGAWA